MLPAGSKGQHAYTAETLNHPTEMFRFLVQLRRGRHLQVFCCRGTCFLQSLSEVSNSLLYTARVIIVAQKSGPYSSEFGLPNFCQEVQYPGEVLDMTGGGRKQERKKHSAAEELCGAKSTQTGKIKVD